MELGHFFYDLLVHNEKFAEKSEDTDSFPFMKNINIHP